MAVGKIDARQQRLRLLHLVDGMRGAKRGHCAAALRRRAFQLIEFDARGAGQQIRECDSLHVVDDYAELARLGEFLDRLGIAPHQVENLAAQEAIHRETQGRSGSHIGVDDFLVERQCLRVIAGAAHHRGENRRRQDARRRVLGRRACVIRLNQTGNGQIAAILPVQQQTARDEQTRIGNRAARLRRLRRFDRFECGIDARCVVNVLGVGRQQIDVHRIACGRCQRETSRSGLLRRIIELEDAVRRGLHGVESRQAMRVGLARALQGLHLDLHFVQGLCRIPVDERL